MFVPETNIAKYIVSSPKSITIFTHALCTCWHTSGKSLAQIVPVNMWHLSPFPKAEHWPHKRLNHFFSKHHKHLLMSKELFSFIQVHSTASFSLRSCPANREEATQSSPRAQQGTNVRNQNFSSSFQQPAGTWKLDFLQKPAFLPVLVNI